MVQRFLIAGMLLALPLAAQKVSVQTTIDSTQIWIGQQTRIRFEITQQPGQWVQAPVFSETLVKGIELVEPVQLDTTLSADGHQVINQSYLVTSFTDSLYLIPAFFRHPCTGLLFLDQCRQSAVRWYPVVSVPAKWN